MIIFFLILLFVGIFIYIVKKDKRWLQHGRFKRSKHITVNEHSYYIEEVEFNSYQEALHKFYRIVEDIAAYEKAKEVKYDLYNWTFTIFQFEDTTIELRHIRSLNRVRLIKSESPMTIEEYEQDDPTFVLQ